MIPQREYFDKEIANSDNTGGYYIIEENDFVYNPRKSADAPYGPISSYKYPDAGIVSPLYLCFRAKEEIIPSFFEWYFRSSAWHRYVYMSGDSGARHDRVSIKDDTFFAMPINIPIADEQKHIASFLDKIDLKIDKQRALVEALKKYKRGLSDAIFDAIAKMETSIVVPFGSILSILQNNTFSRDELFSSNDGVKNIHYGDVLIKYGAVLNMSSTQVPTIKPGKDLGKYSSSSYLLNGDVVFADTAEDYSVGKATEIYNADGLAILSGLHTIPCRSNTAFAPMYLGYYFNSGYFKSKIYPMIQGTKVSSISKSEIIKTTLLIPPYSTQEKIAAVLRKLDARIEIEEKTVLELIQVKCGVLQQLFI